jgi:hypothetical protein
MHYCGHRTFGKVTEVLAKRIDRPTSVFENLRDEQNGHMQHLPCLFASARVAGNGKQVSQPLQTATERDSCRPCMWPEEDSVSMQHEQRVDGRSRAPVAVAGDLRGEHDVLPPPRPEPAADEAICATLFVR